MKSIIAFIFFAILTSVNAQCNADSFSDSLFKTYAKSEIISADGKYSLTFNQNKQSILKHIKSDSHLRTFKGNFIFNTVRFSKDNKYIASGSWGKFAQLWEMKTARYIRSFEEHEGWITCLEFSPDSKYLATASQDFTAKLWNISEGKEVKHFIGHSSFITSINFSPNGKYLVTRAWDGTFKLWEIESGEEKETFCLQDSIHFSGSDDQYYIDSNKKNRD